MLFTWTPQIIIKKKNTWTPRSNSWSKVTRTLKAEHESKCNSYLLDTKLVTWTSPNSIANNPPISTYQLAKQARTRPDSDQQHPFLFIYTTLTSPTKHHCNRGLRFCCVPRKHDETLVFSRNLRSHLLFLASRISHPTPSRAEVPQSQHDPGPGICVSVEIFFFTFFVEIFFFYDWSINFLKLNWMFVVLLRRMLEPVLLL